MQHALKVSASLLDADAATLCELAGAAGQLQLRHRLGLELADGLSCSADSTSLFGRCLMTGQPVLVFDWHAERRFDRPAALAVAGIRATLAVQVPAGNWIGVLSVHSHRPDAFEGDSVGMLGELAGVMAAGVRRVALEHMLYARSDQHAALAELGRLALFDMPLQDVLEQAARLIGGAIGADLVTVSSRDPDGRLQLRSAHPAQSAGDPAGLAADGSPTLVADWAAIGGAPQGLAEHSLRCSVTAGMGPHGRHGALAVHSRQANRFGWADARLVDACASVLATAVERSNVQHRSAAQRTPSAALAARNQPMAVAAMLRADSEERARIAGELHDDTVQEMAAILITLDRVVNAARRGDADVVLSTTVQARATLASATEHARRLLFELRSPLLDAGGLRVALAAAAAAGGPGDGVEISVGGLVGRHPYAVEDLVYRAMTALIGISRARPGVTRVSVELDQVDGHLVGLVEDDGPAGQVPAASDATLAPLVERIALAGGGLEVGRSAAGGTSARLRVPLAS